MNDTVIAVEKNDRKIAKVYFNNVRNEGGKVSATLTAVDEKEKKIATEVTSAEIAIKDHLVPAGLKALGLTSPAVTGLSSSNHDPAEEELKKSLDDASEKLEATQKKVDAANNKIDELNKQIETLKAANAELQKAAQESLVSKPKK